MSKEDTTRVPQQARSIEKRKRLVDAALALFEEKGFQGTNAKEIAKAAGVSVGTFYAYFTDKKAILLDVIGEHLADVDEFVLGEIRRAIQNGATGRQLMRRIIELGHDSHHHSPGLQRVMLSMRYSDEEYARHALAEAEALISKLVTLFESLRDSLRVTDLEAGARVVAYAFEETMHTVAVFGDPMDRARLYEALADMTAVYLFKDPDAAL